ncbi:hypothetical protein K9L97_02635 [Candidatus Woesearchaeota archaeon]|nr:hypothetical protein [Candidatus Woesearchaeota archaeon]
MLKNLINIFDKREYMSWQEYHEKMIFLENFYWQQTVRKKSARNAI